MGGFFAAGAGKRAAAESGSRRAVTEREADDLVRDADRFLALVETSLGLTEHAPVPRRLRAGRVVRPLRAPACRLRLLPAVRRLAPPRPRRAGGRAGDGRPRPDRPGRHLRRGPVRQGGDGRGHPPDPRCRPGLLGRRPSRSGAPLSRQPAPHPDPGRRLPRPPAAPGHLPGQREAGWAAVCRLVSATHHAGERGTPVCTPELVAEHVAGHATSGCCSGRPRSWAGRPRCAATTSGRGCCAAGWTWSGPSSSRSRWSPTGCPGSGPGSSPHAARMAGLARSAAATRVPVVLSNAVRFADRLDAPTDRRARRRPSAGADGRCATSTAATPRAS